MADLILLVDDDADVRAVMAEVLIDVGYGILEAENGLVALALLATMKAAPCLVVLDLRMPVMGGEEFLERLSKIEKLAKLPVIVMTAANVRCLREGTVRLLHKPLSLERFLAVIREYCPHPSAA